MYTNCKVQKLSQQAGTTTTKQTPLHQLPTGATLSNRLVTAPTGTGYLLLCGQGGQALQLLHH
jgi:hypothetical protein